MKKIVSTVIIFLALYLSFSLLMDKEVENQDSALEALSGSLPDEYINDEHDHEGESPDAHENNFHYHTGFRVVVDGKLQNYDGGDYMHFTPCGIAPSKSLTDPFERIHLHNYIGDVAHVHAEVVTWREFFQGLKMNDLLSRDDVSVYISGVKVESGLDTLVNEYDSVLIVFGDEELIELDEQKYWASKEKIIEGESGVEYCGDQD